MNPLDSIIAQQRAPSGPSLVEMAAGGFNHAEKWMNPAATTNYPGQSPNNSANPADSDVPPGAPPYASGPLANPPRPTPAPRSGDPDSPPGAPDYASGPLAINPRPSPTPTPRSDRLGDRFTWSMALESQPTY